MRRIGGECVRHTWKRRVRRCFIRTSGRNSSAYAWALKIQFDPCGIVVAAIAAVFSAAIDMRGNEPVF